MKYLIKKIHMKRQKDIDDKKYEYISKTEK